MTTSDQSEMNASIKGSAAEGGGAHSPDDLARIGRVSDFAWVRLFGHRLIAPLLLVVLSAAMFAPGLMSVPPLDRDEPRFAQATKQMLQSGDYVDIRFQDDPRHKKPIGIYWIQAFSAKITGSGETSPIWAYRLPSFLGAIAAVLLTYWAARAFTSPSGALLAGILLASIILLGTEARLAKTDAMLLACVVAAQGALARLYLSTGERRRWGMSFVLWTAMAMGVLVKGPLVLMVLGLTMAGLCIYQRDVRWMKRAAPLAGVLWLAALVSPWLIAISLATDGQFFQEALGKDLLGKVASGQESHGAPPFTHLAAGLLTFWPLPAFVVFVLAALRPFGFRPGVAFCLTWFVPSWIVFELVATKLPHYTLPLAPALAILCGVVLSETSNFKYGKFTRWAATLLFAIPVGLVIIVNIGAPAFLGVWPSPPAVMIVLLAGYFAYLAAKKIQSGAPYAAIPSVVLCAFGLFCGTWAFTMPALKPIWISPRLTAAVSQAAQCEHPVVASAGFNEPSYVFLQGTDTLLGSAEEAARHLGGAPDASCFAAVVESREEKAFLDAVRENGFEVRLVSRVMGLNINGGKELNIGVYLPISDQNASGESADMGSRG